MPVLLACFFALVGQPAAHSQTTTPTYVLWASSSGALSLWNYSITAGTYSQNTYGPYPGWTASSIAAGPDGLARVLWVNASGAASIWSVAATGTFTQSTFGPFPGWTAQTLSVGDDGTTHVLWTNSSGAAAIWNYNTTSGGFTQNTYGPYPGWTAGAMADGPDGMTRVLWTNAAGAASIWSLDNSAGTYTEFTSGPYADWTATALSVGEDNTTHVLWNDTSGAASVWNYSTSDGSFTVNTYGAFPGWSAKSIADGADGITRLAWDNGGATSLWDLNTTTGSFTQNSFGPYAGWSVNEIAAGGSLTVATPDFGPNVMIFTPSMSVASIQSAVNTVFNTQETNQFGTQRYAFLFQPGAYGATGTGNGLDIPVGYYTQVLGLGQSPDDTTITGYINSTDTGVCENNGNNALCNFWRGAENLAVVPSDSSEGGVADTDLWAVSQAAPMRRMHIKGNLQFDDGAYSSGGFLADTLVDGNAVTWAQQQWMSRNNQWTSWDGGNWNMVFVGDVNPPSGSFPSYTTVADTPVVREKPFLTYNSGAYSVFVPSVVANSQGPSWSPGPEPGTSIPISQFYIAQAGTDTAETMNAALSKGLNLLLTPGIYNLDEPINITNPNTTVLGIGLPTLIPENGVMDMTVADVDGVDISGILFDAGTTNSPILLQVGPRGSSQSHAANPTSLHDDFGRIGGDIAGQATEGVEINSNDVIGDDFWIWRADHGNSGTVGWTVNVSNNGLVVNGLNDTIYGLAVEHFEQYQTLWNGDDGSVYFYQSEAPYDPPSQSAWMAGSEDGYASYEVSSAVTSHQAYGLGVYAVFNNTSIVLDNAIECPPNLTGVNFTDMVTIGISGTIDHIINGTGSAVDSSNFESTLDNYPGTSPAPPVN